MNIHNLTPKQFGLLVGFLFASAIIATAILNHLGYLKY